jgi:hypothetical protein
VETLFENPVGNLYTWVGAKDLSGYPLGWVECEREKNKMEEIIASIYRSIFLKEILSISWVVANQLGMHGSVVE